MGFLIAGIEGETIWMVADHWITIGANGEQTVPNSPILETVRKPGLIGMLGDTSSYDLIFEIAQMTMDNPFGATLPSSIVAGLPPDDLIPMNLFAATVSEPIFFAYAIYVEGAPRLFCFHGGQVDAHTDTMMMDTGSAMELVQKYLKDTGPHPPFEDFNLEGVETTSQFFETARAALLARFDQSTATRKAAIAPYLLTPQGSRLCTYSYSTMEPVEQKQPSTVLDHLTGWLRHPARKKVTWQSTCLTTSQKAP